MVQRESLKPYVPSLVECLQHTRGCYLNYMHRGTHHDKKEAMSAQETSAVKLMASRSGSEEGLNREILE
jgi:hypothetical protein